MNLFLPEGATPLDPDAIAGLIPGLTTQAELNEFEAANIAVALRCAARSRSLRRDLLSTQGLRLLHRRMFDRTWHWAGDFRCVQTNIGVEWHQISVQLAALCADTQHQREHVAFGDHPAGWDEWAARFHHRLVLIHPFPNGNGRHARLATDLLLSQSGLQPFTWGAASEVEGEGQNLTGDSPVRRRSLAALHTADRGDLAPLCAFTRAGGGVSARTDADWSSSVMPLFHPVWHFDSGRDYLTCAVMTKCSKVTRGSHISAVVISAHLPNTG